jgi:hypothetical protein
MPLLFQDPPNFIGNPGKVTTFLYQLNTFASLQALFSDDRHKIVYATSLLSNGAADWATGFAADMYSYLFSFWEDFNTLFHQEFIFPLSALSALSHILQIKQVKLLVAEYVADFLNLAT